jgi:drug/metabolite transporter (DMT)-like permease
MNAEQKTIGVSPKVKLPAAVVGALGVVLIVIGIIVNNDEVLNAGIGLVVASPIGAAFGYISPPGTVVPTSTPTNTTAGKVRQG